MVQGGAVLFVWQEPGIYEVYANFLKAYRGEFALATTAAAIHWMFVSTECMSLETKVPTSNRSAVRLCERLGAKKTFERDALWPTATEKESLLFYTLRYDDWISQDAEAIEAGKLFINQMFEQRHLLGRDEPQQPADDCLYANLGAVSEMMLAGFLEKGVIVYNRWARFASVPPIQLVSRQDPAVIDLGDMVVQIKDGTFKAILCR
jgi:hypothetical protein